MSAVLLPDQLLLSLCRENPCSQGKLSLQMSILITAVRGSKGAEKGPREDSVLSVGNAGCILSFSVHLVDLLRILVTITRLKQVKNQLHRVKTNAA